jgi:hypothetical protein
MSDQRARAAVFVRFRASIPSCSLSCVARARAGLANDPCRDFREAVDGFAER